MTAPTCVRCTRPVDGTAYGCSPCASLLAERLRFAAGLDPDATIARLDRFGDEGHGGDHGLPVDLRAAQRVRAVRNTVTTWCRVAEERGEAAPDGLDGQLRWLAGQTGWLRFQRFFDEAHRDLDRAVDTLMSVVDAPVSRVDLGPCGGDKDGDPCVERLTAPKGAGTAKCRNCGTSYIVEDRKAWLLGQLNDTLQDARTIALALRVYGVDCTTSMLRGYVRRGRLAQHGADARGVALFRVGDVLDLVWTEERKEGAA